MIQSQALSSLLAAAHSLTLSMPSPISLAFLVARLRLSFEKDNRSTNVDHAHCLILEISLSCSINTSLLGPYEPLEDPGVEVAHTVVPCITVDELHIPGAELSTRIPAYAGCEDISRLAADTGAGRSRLRVS